MMRFLIWLGVVIRDERKELSPRLSARIIEIQWHGHNVVYHGPFVLTPEQDEEK